jgi:exopolysaccharide biosynthesis polyprenyl glycosylphosphotransferase
MIPGADAACWNKKKPPRGTGATFMVRDAATAFPFAEEKYVPHAIAPVLPQAMESEEDEPWLLSALKDYSLVILDWILVAQIYIRLQMAFPRIAAFPGGWRPSAVSPALIGIALLHGVLIHLLNYRDRRHFEETDLDKERWTLGKAVIWGTLVLSVALQLQGYSMPAVAMVWTAGLLHFATLWGWRWAERENHQKGLRAIRGVRNVLIVGAGPLGRRIASYLSKHPEMGRSVYGFLDDKKPLGNGVVGRTGNLVELARTAFVDEVILASPHDQDLTLRVLNTARQLRLDVKIAPHLFGCEPDGAPERLGSIPLISLHEEKLPVRALRLKRTLDVAGAAIALFLLAPVLAAIAILIKVDSRGPFLYKAPRAGRKGRPFQCYKFRTMVRDADDLKDALRERNQRQGPFFKITNDPRITRVGRFLRRYSLDEIPQLWNVLKGEMSMVGPRPHPLDDVCTYAIEHLRRLDVLPGMTGLWQVTARRNPSFQTGVKLDVEYIRSWSVKMDLLILWKTAGAVLRGSGE